MLTKAPSYAVVGLDGAIVEVEVDNSPGLPSFTRPDGPANSLQNYCIIIRKNIHS